MANEIQIQNPYATSSSNIRAKMIKSASYKGKQSPSWAAKDNIIAKKITTPSENKSTIDAPKKQCLCAPTTHAGSFKCRLHRALSTQNSSKKITNGGQNCFNGALKMSRFGRAVVASATAGDQPTI